MKKNVIIILILLISFLQFSWRSGVKNNIAAEPLRKWILQEIILLKKSINEVQQADRVNLKKSGYLQARKHYKHIEFFIEHYSTLQAKLYINGPLVPKHEPDLGSEMVQPQGFQRIEEVLYTSDIKKESKKLVKEITLLKQQVNAIEKYYRNVEIDDGDLLEMCQLQLFRMATLNLNGYDATISQTNITETLWVLEGIEKTISFFKPYTLSDEQAKNSFVSLQKELLHGKALLNANKEYDSFNRLGFITQFINPANKLLVEFHNHAGLPWNTNKKALRLSNPSLFDESSFEPRFFSMYYDDTLNLDEQAKIGKLLFYDKILSGNNQYSCATCHNPNKAFTDGLPKSLSIDGTSQVKRNAPSLLNVSFQKAFFYDGSAYQLEQQISDVVHNQSEMKSSLEDIVSRLQQNETYKQLFSKAFAGSINEGITEYAVQKALTEYEKTLVSFNSRFDQYIRGDSTALNKREINGYNIFGGKALCASCHFFPLFNGTVPPYFTDSEFEVIGTPNTSDNKEVDTDIGRLAVTGIKEQRYAFKTPSVRNVELTAPYMHNGIYKSLEEVVEFYHKGGGNGFNFNIPNQTLPFDSLKLSANEKEDIILFLKTLTDSSSYHYKK